MEGRKRKETEGSVPPPPFNNITTACRSRWKAVWQSASVVNKNLISDPTVPLPGFDLGRSTLNRFRIGHGRCA